MKRALGTSLAVAVLLAGSHQLPAPISEIPATSTPAPAVSTTPKPTVKAKSIDVKVPTKKKLSANVGSANPARQLDGVWMGTEEANNQKTATTLIVKSGKTAIETFEKTIKPDTYWNDLPHGTDNRAPIYFRMKRDSINLRLEDSTLTIQWHSFSLLDWTPKSIPYSWFAEGETSRKLFHDEERQQYMLDGDRLVSKGVVFHRVR